MVPDGDHNLLFDSVPHLQDLYGVCYKELCSVYLLKDPRKNEIDGAHLNCSFIYVPEIVIVLLIVICLNQKVT